jgi:hypothetical protein
LTDIDTTTEPPAEQQPAEQPGPGARALRQALERAHQREAEAREQVAALTPLQGENQRLRRVLGVVRAGFDPDSAFAQGVIAAAAANGIEAPEDVAALGRLMAAEARGELPTTNGNRSASADRSE